MKKIFPFHSRLISLTLILLIFFVSCTTTQSNVIVERPVIIHEDNRLLELEAMIVLMEANALLLAGTNTQVPRVDADMARNMIRDLENDAHGDLNLSGILTAWSGRLAVLEGRINEAVRMHTQSQSAAPGNIPGIILGIRLAGSPASQLLVIERELSITSPNAPGFTELQIERGRTLLELNRFAEATAAFDAAFTSDIKDIYRESYIQHRNIAWEMRNADTASAGTIGVLGGDAITWNDSITIALNETQLLRFISGGRAMTNSEFFTRLLERGFIPYTQDINLTDWPSIAPNANDPVTRAGAAWFIWHLYAEARADRSMLTRYSSRFSTGPNPRSPIADVPPLSPFFDSILGSVETELLHLIDGRSFAPAELIRGAELLAILRRIDR